MKLETPFIAIMFISLFFTGMYTVITSVADEYDVSYNSSVYNTGDDTNLTAAFNKIAQSKNEMDNLTKDFEDTEPSDTGSLYSFFSLALKIGKQVFGSMVILKNMFSAFTQSMGIPTEFFIVFFSIISVSFVLLVIFILLGRSVVS